MTNVTHAAGSNEAVITTDDKPFRRKLDKLAEKYPDAVTVQNSQNGLTVYSVPWAWVSIRSPIKRQFTDEYRAELAERMKQGQKKRWNK